MRNWKDKSLKIGKRRIQQSQYPETMPKNAFPSKKSFILNFSSTQSTIHGGSFRCEAMEKFSHVCFLEAFTFIHIDLGTTLDGKREEKEENMQTISWGFALKKLSQRNEKFIKWLARRQKLFGRLFGHVETTLEAKFRLMQWKKQ